MRTSPKIVDDDRDEITAHWHGEEIRGWSYRDEPERRVKMLAAKEFAEGWYTRAKKSEAVQDALQSILDAIGDEDEITARWIAGIQPSHPKAPIAGSDIMLKGSFLETLRDARRTLAEARQNGHDQSEQR